VVVPLLSRVGPFGLVVEDGGGPSRRHAVVVAGNDGMPSVRSSHHVLP
jgi:hypothetical protein